MKTENKNNHPTIKNKKCYYEYEMLDTYVAGIELKGTEIKSIRQGKASLADTYCYFKDNELYLKNCYIAKYDTGSFFNHDEYREKKLLLNKQELRKLALAVKIVGNTIVPTKMFFNEKGLCKIEIALARGKKNYDKRESLKEKDIKRDVYKELKNQNYI